MRSILLVLALGCFGLAGCTSSFGVGDDNGLGMKSTFAKDGKIVMIEPTDGDGNIRD